MLKEEPTVNVDAEFPFPDEEPVKTRIVTAKYPDHVWHVDLTAVPTSAGYCVSWSPFSIPQSWPFCYWIAVVLDHYSRKVMGLKSKTPDEVYDGLVPANKKPRIEPQAKYPRRSPCASPQASIRGKPMCITTGQYSRLKDKAKSGVKKSTCDNKTK